MPNWLNSGRTGDWPKIDKVYFQDQDTITRDTEVSVASVSVRTAMSLSACSGGLPATPWMHPDHLASEADKFYRVYRTKFYENRPPYYNQTRDCDSNFGVTLSSLSTYLDYVHFAVPGGLPFLRRMAVGLTLILVRIPTVRISDEICLRNSATQIPPSESVLSVAECNRELEVILAPNLCTFASNLKFVQKHSLRLSDQESKVTYTTRPPPPEKRMRMQDPSFISKNCSTLGAVDIVSRQCIEHVFHAFKTISSKLKVWTATPDNQAVLNAWNEVLQFCGASIQFYFAAPDARDASMDDEIVRKAIELHLKYQKDATDEEEDDDNVFIFSPPHHYDNDDNDGDGEKQEETEPPTCHAQRKSGSKGSGGVNRRSKVSLVWSQRYHVYSPLPHRHIGIQSNHRKFRTGWLLLKRMAETNPNTPLLKTKMKFKKRKRPTGAVAMDWQPSSNEAGPSTSAAAAAAPAAVPDPGAPAVPAAENEEGHDDAASDSLSKISDLTHVLTSDCDMSSNELSDSNSSSADPAVPKGSRIRRRRRSSYDEENDNYEEEAQIEAARDVLYSMSSEEYYVTSDGMVRSYNDDVDTDVVQRQFRIHWEYEEDKDSHLHNARCSSFFRERHSTHWQDRNELITMNVQYVTNASKVCTANAAAADVLTARRQWKTDSAGGASGIELRISPTPDEELVGCMDTRKMKGLAALYMFLHLHGHHVRKLKIAGCNSEGRGEVRESVMSNVIPNALRMCTQIRVVEATEIAIADICLASMGSTVNVCDVHVYRTMRMRGPEAAAAVPVANGMFPRDYTMRVSGLTLSWQHRILNAALASKCDEMLTTAAAAAATADKPSSSKRKKKNCPPQPQIRC